MKKIAIISCYFGKLPSYFPLWLNSCKVNNDVNFIFVTDNCLSNIPKNIKVINQSLEELCRLASEKINMDIQVNNPYKLCDFKPAYGLIFEDYLKEYDYYAYCDIDLIFGRIREFVTDDILENNDVVLNLGHLTIFKNSDFCKKLFMCSGAIYSYDKVFSTDENYAFDEMSGMHLIMDKNNIVPYLNIPIADIDVKHKRFLINNFKNYNKQLFFYDGNVNRVYLENNEIKYDKFCYIHFQKRKLETYFYNMNVTKFIICNNGFFEIKDDISIEDIEIYNPYKGARYEKLETVLYIKRKLMKFIRCGYKQRKIWIKQKVYSKGVKKFG